MVDWRECKLGELVQIKHGFAFLGEHFANAGTHVVLTPGNFLEEGGFKEKSDKAKWYNGPIPDDYVLNEGDLIVAMTEQAEGLLGSSALIPRSGFYLHNQRLGLVQIRERKQADQRFIYYLFNSKPVRQQIRGSASGTKIRHTAPSRIEGVKVSVPPLPMQRKIAGILSAYDELMENSQRRIRILEAMARALYREWFVHFRFPGHETVPRVASPFGDIPQSWEVVSIDDVCARVTDGSHNSPKSVEEGLPMASSKDMHDWGLNLDTARLISPEDFADLVRNDCKPKKNDVLITKDGANYLKYIFVTRAEQEVVLLSSVAMLRPNARINPHLLAAILKEPENKGRLKNYVTGAAIPRVILKDFKRFALLLPSKEVQMAWAKIGEPITEQIWRLIDKIQNLRRTRDLLLPRLLSGQVELALSNGKDKDL
jgi:type I restriction enzyme S subunit